VNALIETNRGKALDVFISGVNGDCGGWSVTKGPCLRVIPFVSSSKMFCQELVPAPRLGIIGFHSLLNIINLDSPALIRAMADPR